MNDVAYRLGTLALGIYADLPNATILECGMRSGQGLLGDAASSSTKWVTLAMEESRAGDLAASLRSLAADDESFDLILATDVLEHDPAFWLSFLEMCRKTKEGGFVYINARSNGAIDRKPEDCWRFYPDSGLALASWAISQGQQVSLVESFVADQDGAPWNAFVAVFRKGRIVKEMPRAFLYENIACSNVRSWQSSDIIAPRDLPQDMLILERATEHARSVEQALADMVADREKVIADVRALQQEQAALTASLAEARQQRDELDSTRSELSAHVAALNKRALEDQVRVDDAKQQLYAEASRRSRAEADSSRLKRQIERRFDQLAELRAALTQLEQSQATRSEEALAKVQAPLRKQVRMLAEKLSASEAARREAQGNVKAMGAQMKERFDEIITLTGLLRDQEEQNDTARLHLDWLRAIHESLTSQPKWWGLMPQGWRTSRERRRLKRHGLFDGDGYLKRYPDIADAGLDPLYHYMTHGYHEGRSR